MPLPMIYIPHLVLKVKSFRNIVAYQKPKGGGEEILYHFSCIKAALRQIFIKIYIFFILKESTFQSKDFKLNYEIEYNKYLHVKFFISTMQLNHYCEKMRVFPFLR